jgi:ribosomal protein S18 acetylase RimI-like enzyme
MTNEPDFRASSGSPVPHRRIVRARRARAGDFEFIAQLGATAFEEFGFAPASARHWTAEHFCTWVAVRSSGAVGTTPLAGGLVEGRPMEHRSLEGNTPSPVAAPAEQRLGFVVLGPCHGVSFELTAVAVLSSERGRGVGKVLLDAAEASAKLQGAREIVAHTADANLAALELLLKRSYRMRRRLERYYGMYAACELVLRL